MTIASPMLLSPVVITTGVNDVIRCDDGNGGGAEDVTIAAGTYYAVDDDSASCLIQAIETALKTSASGSGWVVSIDSDDKVQCTNSDTSGTWAVYWGHGNTTFDETVIGVAAGTTWAETQDEIETADNWCAYRWTATQGVSVDTEGEGEGVVNQHLSLGAQVYTVKLGADRDVRIIGFVAEPKRKAIAVSGYTGQAWRNDFWPTANAGETVRYYPDQTVTGTYDEYVLDKDACEAAKPQRRSPGLALYDWLIVMREYVS